MKLITVFAATLLLVSGSVLAQQKGPGAANNTLNKIDPLGPEAQAAQAQWMDKPLPEMKGVLSWKTLGEVKPVKQKDKFVPEFAKAVAALDKKEVKILRESDILAKVAPGTALRDGLERILRGRTGALIVLGWDRTVEQIAAASGATAALSIPLSSFEATDYKLEIKVTDKVSGKSITQNVQFNVGA